MGVPERGLRGLQRAWGTEKLPILGDIIDHHLLLGRCPKDTSHNRKFIVRRTGNNVFWI